MPNESPNIMILNLQNEAIENINFGIYFLRAGTMENILFGR